MKIDWKKKLCSRKLWMALTGFVSGMMILCGGSESAAQEISGCIMAGASVVAYIIGEGLADSGNGGNDNG